MSIRPLFLRSGSLLISGRPLGSWSAPLDFISEIGPRNGHAQPDFRSLQVCVVLPCDTLFPCDGTYQNAGKLTDAPSGRLADVPNRRG